MVNFFRTQKTYQRLIDLSNLVALGAVSSMLLLACLTIVDIVLRAGFSAPIFALFEFTQLALAVTIAALFPASLVLRKHITVDVLVSDNAEGAPLFSFLGSLFLAGFIALLAWWIAHYASQLISFNAQTLLLSLPVGPVWLAVSALLGFGALALIYVAFADFSPKAARAALRSPQWLIMCAGFVVFAVVIVYLIWTNAFPTTSSSARSLLAVFMLFLLWFLALFRVPLGAAMGVSGCLGLCILIGWEEGLSAASIQTTAVLSNVNFAVLPLFLMMGSFAATSGIASGAYKFAYALFRRRRGGLAMATILGSAGFGTVTGSSAATVATIGRIAYPEMRNHGYAEPLSTGSIAAGGTLGSLIPPSGLIILYAILSRSSITELFAAVLVPAALSVFLYFGAIFFWARLRPGAAPEQRSEMRQSMIEAALSALPATVLFGFIIGGLFFGIFTPVEAAAVGAAAAFLYTLLTGAVTRSSFLQVMGDTAAASANIYLLVIGGFVFSLFVGMTELPQTIISGLSGLEIDGLILIFFILVLLILMGTVFDAFGIMIVTVPILAPVIAQLGYDPLWWGVIMIIVVEIGVLTPPFGLNIFVMKGVEANVNLMNIYKGVLPFVIADLLKLIVLVLFPAIVLWFPEFIQ